MSDLVDGYPEDMRGEIDKLRAENERLKTQYHSGQEVISYQAGELWRLGAEIERLRATIGRRAMIYVFCGLYLIVLAGTLLAWMAGPLYGEVHSGVWLGALVWQIAIGGGLVVHGWHKQSGSTEDRRNVVMPSQDMNELVTDTRSCTCYPGEGPIPPIPCPRKFALRHCWQSAVREETQQHIVRLKNIDRNSGEQALLDYLMRVRIALEW